MNKTIALAAVLLSATPALADKRDTALSLYEAVGACWENRDPWAKPPAPPWKPGFTACDDIMRLQQEADDRAREDYRAKQRALVDRVLREHSGQKP